VALLLLRFLAAKAVRLAALLLVVAALSFTLVSLSPIDPVDAYVGKEVMRVSPEQREAIARRWGLDRPPVERFARWAGRLAEGDFGHSTIFDEPVLSVIDKRFRTSLWLMAAAWTLSGLIGFGLGLTAGAMPGTWIDRAIRLYAYTLAATPTFWIGLVLLSVFSVSLGLTPVCCAWPPGLGPDEATLAERLHHLVLPAATLSLIGVAQIALHTREKTIDALRSDHALFARAQGESTAGIVLRHCLRGVALPALTLQFASLGELFGGSVLAEQVFAYPGLGRATVEAGIRGDVPLLLGIVLFSALFVFVGNTLADLAYLVVDPRLREVGRNQEIAA